MRKAIVVIARCLSGCCSAPNGTYTRHVVVAWDGSGDVPLNVRSDRLRHVSLRQPDVDVKSGLLSSNQILLADEAEARLGERVNFEKLDKSLMICRGC
jgi:hypothetical protein